MYVLPGHDPEYRHHLLVKLDKNILLLEFINIKQLTISRRNKGQTKLVHFKLVPSQMMYRESQKT